MVMANTGVKSSTIVHENGHDVVSAPVIRRHKNHGAWLDQREGLLNFIWRMELIS